MPIAQLKIKGRGLAFSNQVHGPARFSLPANRRRAALELYGLSPKMENNPQLTNFTPTSNIQTYAILTDGSIHGPDQKISASQDAPYNGKPITALLYLVDGISESTSAGLRKLVPSLPQAFISGHFSDNLGQIDNALDDTHVFLAKWSRAAAQAKEIWLREKRLRTFGTPFNVDEANPVASRLDHNCYDHITEPYRSYNPIYEFEIAVPFPRNTGEGNCRVTAPVIDESSKPKDVEGQQKVPEDEERAIDTPPALRNKIYIQDMVMHAANECISLYHHNVGDRLIGKHLGKQTAKGGGNVKFPLLTRFSYPHIRSTQTVSHHRSSLRPHDRR